MISLNFKKLFLNDFFYTKTAQQIICCAVFNIITSSHANQSLETMLSVSFAIISSSLVGIT